MRAWFFLTVAILSEVTATLCLKVALEHPVVYGVVVVGYIVAFSSLHQVLRCGMHVGAAYGIWGAHGCGPHRGAVRALLRRAAHTAHAGGHGLHHRWRGLRGDGRA